jgi:hypothetical protein
MRIRKLYPELRRRPPEPVPTELQEQVILGCLLGDARFNKIKNVRTGKLYTGAGIIIKHSIKQEHYVNWKYELLKTLTNAPPHTIGSEKSDYGFYVRANRFTRSIRELGSHPLSYDFLKLINHPIALAVWYGDDGGTAHSGDICTFSTQGFTKEENEMLAKWLWKSWRIEANVTRQANYYLLTLTKRGSVRLLDLISSYLSEAFPQKIPQWYRRRRQSPRS